MATLAEIGLFSSRIDFRVSFYFAADATRDATSPSELHSSFQEQHATALRSYLTCTKPH